MRNQHLLVHPLHPVIRISRLGIDTISLRGLIVSLLTGFFLSGCATAPQWPSTKAGTPVPGLDQRRILQAVPFYPQEQYQCGPAALAMMLNTQGFKTDPDALTDRVYLPERHGTLQVELVSAARDYGLVVYPLAKDVAAIMQEIAAGHPVLVMQNLRLDWWPQWHFAVVIGFDPRNQSLILNTDTRQAVEQPITVFMNTWKRADQWAVVMLPPDELPATAEPLPFLRAAHDLESTGHLDAAYTAYQQAAQTWPDQPAALFGLGNVAYQRGQWRSAARHFQTLVTRFPRQAAGWNNLAYTLQNQGCETAARAAAVCASKLDPDRFDGILDDSLSSRSPAKADQCPDLSCPDELGRSGPSSLQDIRNQ